MFPAVITIKELLNWGYEINQMLPKSFCDQRYSRVHRNKSKALHMTKVAKLLPIYLSVLNKLFINIVVPF